MIDTYAVMLKDAKVQFGETKKFFKKLKKIKSGKLDSIFESYHIPISKQINCLDCANCCIGTGPLLKDRDINRLSKTLGMKNSSFLDEYVIRDEDGDNIFKKLPCPFLGTDHYCFVYEDRPAACRDYPHTDRRNMKKYLQPTLENYLICPIVYLVIEELKKLNL